MPKKLGYIGTSRNGTTDRLTGTEEQEAIWKRALESDTHIVVKAVAGSGKTWTGVQYCLRAPKDLEIAFCAFNKHIQTELAQKIDQSNVVTKTYHSLGYAALRYGLGRQPELDQNKVDGILESLIKTESKRDKMQVRSAARRLVSLAKQYGVIEREDLETLVDHHLIDLEGIEEWVYNLVPRTLNECKANTKTIDYDDMVWLPKELGLRMPRYDLMLIDEAQDTNPSQQWLALNSADRLIVIGDPNQCQPGKTRVYLEGGQRKAIYDLAIGDKLISFDRHSHAFVGRTDQGRKVTAVSSRPYKGTLHTICAGDFITECTPNHKFLTRWTDRSVDRWCTYLMRRGSRFRIGWCQLFNGASDFHLGQRARLEKADSAWILEIYDNKSDASFCESMYASKFGIPTLMFQQADGANIYTQAFLDRFWAMTEEILPDLFKNAEKLLLGFGRNIDYPIWTKGEYERHGRTTVFQTQACNLISDLMAVPIYLGYTKPTWEPLKTSRRFHGGNVYSLEVETHHNYIADGILTCNSIYGFRGADVYAMQNIENELAETQRDVIVMPLTLTRRCPKSHVKLAQRIVPEIHALDTAPEGIIRIMDNYEANREMQPGDLVLCRTNADLAGAAYKLIERGTKAIVRGKNIGEGIERLIQSAQKRLGQNPIVSDLLKTAWDITNEQIHRYMRIPDDKGVNRANAVQDRYQCLAHLATDAESVNEIHDRIQKIFRDFDDTGKPIHAVTLGTVHRTKGLEASRVFVLRPELIPHPAAKKEWERQQERNLGYVACTRAKYTEDHPGELIWVGNESPLFV